MSQQGPRNSRDPETTDAGCFFTEIRRDTLSWSKDKKGRDCLVLRRGGQVDRLAFAVTDAKGKLSAPIVLTGELSKLKTWFDDAIADFEETAYRFRKLTERAR